jgi:hypothetical protein
MNIEQIARSLASIQDAFNAFSRLLADLREAGLPDDSFRTRLVKGVLHDVEFFGKNHQLVCEFEIGIESPRVSFRLICREGPKEPSVNGSYDMEKCCWVAHINNAPQDAMPEWLKPFMDIVQGVVGTDVEGAALAHAQLIRATVPLLAWSSYESRASAPETRQTVRP